MKVDEAPPSARYWRAPALADDDRIVGGVAAGVAAELGLKPIWTRIGFVALFASSGLGAVLYGLAWGAMALAGDDGNPQPRVAKGLSLRQRQLGFACFIIGAFWLTQTLVGFSSTIVWALALLGGGLIAGTQRFADNDDWRSAKRWALAAEGLARTVGGFLPAVGLLILLARFGGPSDGGVLVVIGLMAAIIGVSAPWWWRLVRERDQERQARIRSEERADVAAHLHDSVLQTLALIQRHSDDPQTMLNLARRQERELRNWLDPGRASREGGSVRGQLDELASEVEEIHRVPVEIVSVGDCLIDAEIETLLAAVREAAMNSAEHSGADQVDIYAEIGDDLIEVFVRDSGKGFDPGEIPTDRHGVRQSILGRMERLGGTVELNSTPGEGTEVELTLARANKEKR